MKNRIPEDILADHWFSFVHDLIGRLQRAFRSAQSANGLTQKDIGDILGKSPSFISRCLTGQQNMTIRTMHDIARAMGYRLEITLRPLAMLPLANRQPQPNKPVNAYGTSTPASYWNPNNPSVTTALVLGK